MTKVTDIKILISFQKVKNSKKGKVLSRKNCLYNEMLRRYNNSLQKQALAIFHGIPAYALGLELEDIQNLLREELLNAMCYFNIEKVNVERFRFNVLFQRYCQKARANLLTKHNADKRKELGLFYYGEKPMQESKSFAHDDEEIIYNDPVDTKYDLEADIIFRSLYDHFVTSLTAKEKKIVKGILEGLSYREIGELLQISSNAVNHHVGKNIQKKAIALRGILEVA